MSQLNNLESINLLYRNSQILSNGSIESIVRSLKPFKNLTKLYLDFYFCNKLENEQVDQISEIVSQQNCLQKIEINLGWNKKISNKSIANLINSLKYQTGIKKLFLSFHYIRSVQQLGQLPKSLKSMTNLSELNLIFGACSSLDQNDVYKIFTLTLKSNNKYSLILLN
ncbi:hypothetical protein ABPG72_011502 [Tetrahymena utriculariae]